jgi:hypothetical protein
MPSKFVESQLARVADGPDIPFDQFSRASIERAVVIAAEHYRLLGRVQALAEVCEAGCRRCAAGEPWDAKSIGHGTGNRLRGCDTYIARRLLEQAIEEANNG